MLRLPLSAVLVIARQGGTNSRSLFKKGERIISLRILFYQFFRLRADAFEERAQAIEVSNCFRRHSLTGNIYSEQAVTRHVRAGAVNGLTGEREIRSNGRFLLLGSFLKGFFQQ